MKIPESNIHTDNQLGTCVPGEGCLCVNTCKESISVGDGKTPGGKQILSSRHASAAALGHFGAGTPTVITITEQNAWVLLNIFSETISCGLSLSCDPETGLITVLKDCTLLVGFSISYTGAMGRRYEMAVLSGGEIVDSIATCGRMNNANDLLSAVALGVGTFSAGDTFGVYVRNTGGTDDITLGSVSFVASRCSA